MTALRELFAKFDVDFDSSKLVAGAAAVDGVWGALGKLKGALLGGAIVGGILALTEGFISAGHELIVTSEQLGVSAEALKKWQAVGKLAGVETEEMNTSLKLLQRNAYAAAQGGGSQATAFAKLHVTLRNSNGELNDADSLLTQVAQGMSGLKNDTERVALAQELLGRSGSRLLPILIRGNEGVDALRNSLEDLGISFSADGARKAEEAHKQMLLFQMVTTSLRSKLIVGLVPAFTAVFGWLARGLGAMNRLTQGTTVFQAALVVLGYAAAGVAIGIITAFAPVILSTLAIVAAVTAAVLIIDDLIQMFTGGKSAIADWIDETYGVGTSTKIVEAVKEAWGNLTAAVSDAWNALGGGRTILDAVLATLKGIGDTIAFVVDQFRALKGFFSGQGEVAEGLKKIWSDIAGGGPAQLDKHIRGGADGFGSERRDTDAQGNVITNGGTRGGSVFGDFTRFAGDATGGQIKAPAMAGGPIVLPETTIGAGKIDNSKHVSITVAGNTKADPKLVSDVKNAVMSGIDARQRDVAAATGGS